MSGSEQDGTGGEPVGSLAEEAGKLLGALSDWAREQGGELGHGVSGLADHAADAARSVGDHVATGSAECRWCPVCRAIHVVRRTSPEVRENLTVAAVSLLQAAAGMLAAPGPEEGARRSGDGVEHIDLGGDWPEEET